MAKKKQKTEKNALSLRIPEKIYLPLKEEAEKSKRSINSQVELILEDRYF